jgi:protein KRI1
LDDEISATLAAIRAKDPRIYTQNVKFYSELETEAGSVNVAKEKPVYLRDYHRQNLLNGGQHEEKEETIPYNREQELVRASLMGAIDAAEQVEEADDFLIQKSSTKASLNTKKQLPDVSIADKDPELYLSNFMSSRAWVPTGPATLQPFDSDDSDEEDKAEAFEYAWNLRFEDPETTNKVLTTHSRAVVTEHSVRKSEGQSARQRARDKERQRKEHDKRDREMERSRLKKLKMDDISEKLAKIRENAGLLDDTEGNVDIATWRDLLEKDWDDEAFDREMTKRFDDSYYGQRENSSRKEPKKPKWDDDLDLKLSDEEVGEESDGEPSKILPSEELKTSSKARRKRDHRVISALAENAIEFPDPAPGAYFQYRESSPTSLGLTPLEILTASDAQLNTYAGLKKLAPWRDPERKEKERKKLGKKARLRHWRVETFGKEEGPGMDRWDKKLEDDVNEDEAVYVRYGKKAPDVKVNGEEKNKKKRGKKKAQPDDK